MNFKKKINIIILFFIFSTASIGKNNICELYLINSDNKKIKLTVEIADTPYKRNTGLMYRKRLSKDRGMIFIFQTPQNLSFWMKNTYIPLSIAYISEDKKINEIYDMKPLDISITYPSKLPAKFALEVNKGWFKKNNITKNSRIIFNGCISK